jgi:hypothetical protein
MSTELGRQILDAVKSYVASHVERVISRVEQIANSLDELRSTVESSPKPQKGDKGDRGDDGRAPTADELREIITPMIPAPLPGPAGERGERGDRGDDGRAPTADELREIIAPMIPAPLPGPAGERGERGDTPSTEELLAIIRPLIPPAAADGERGERGEIGPPGPDGHTPSVDELREIITPLIPPPVAGERGLDGNHGRDGRDGADGRDAAQIDVLPMIDESRSYPRGTYARHAGGLWRSFETTFGLRGWECLVEGIAEESETMLEDGRTLVRRTIYSSGRMVERSIQMAVVLDKGVYKADANYAAGDAVTWAGSIWIAQKRDDATLPYGKPSTPGSGWRLAVKAGRDARP